MANNSVALGRNDGPDFFADDDPLAELARIAGYDERPSRSVQPAEPPRVEPVFNLEDELLREFERYDAPRLDPVEDVRLEPQVPSLPAAPVPSEPHPTVVLRERFAEADPFADPEPVSSAPAAHVSPLPESISARDSEIFAVQPEVPVGLSMPERRGPVEPSFDSNAFDLDLISELETSLAAAPVAPASSRPSSRPPARAYEPGFRMPLANFNRAPEPQREPRSAVPHAVEPVRVPEPVAVAAPTVDPVRPSEVTRAAEPAVDMRSAWDDGFALDTPSRAEPVAERFSSQEEPVYDVEHYSREAAVKPSVVAIFEAPVEKEAAAVAPASERSEPAVAAASTDFGFDDEFDLVLEDLELDLSDLMADEVASAPASVAPVKASAPVVAAPAPAPAMARVSQPMPVEPRVVEPKPIKSQPVAEVAVAAAVPAFLANSRSAAASADVRPAPQPAKPQPVLEEPVFDDPDMFDPALLSDAEEMPEAVAELNVPELPVHEPEKPHVAHSDYDLDLDAELASFLETTNAEARAPVAPAAKAVPDATPVAAPRTAKPVPNDGLDDFERALEEDFRRSLSAPIQGRTRVEEDDEAFEAYDEPVVRRPASAFILPLTAAGFLLIAGVSGYVWFAGDSGNISGDGAPVVIAADTDPIKMVPENPGGKTVPNQNKAVYDRVAGGALGDPKQPSLISSDEQPVDVVQKTLVPEGFSLEGETDEMPPAVTEEARLSPGEAAPAEPSVPQDQLAVMPRKVKTMIVRADGTLVEQVSDAPAAAPTAAPVLSEKIPAAPALAEPMQTASTTPQVAPVSAPEAPTDLSSVNIASATPVSGASVGTPAPSAPIPATRPAQQPVTVVASVSDQGTVRQPATPTPASATSSTPAAPSASAGAGGYFVQVASLPSEADAQKSYRNLSTKFANVIGGRGVDIAKAEIAGKGTFYRVRIPAGSKDEAAALCERYRAAGGSCLIAR